jgi:hypothetical protein
MASKISKAINSYIEAKLEDLEPDEEIIVLGEILETMQTRIDTINFLLKQKKSLELEQYE